MPPQKIKKAVEETAENYFDGLEDAFKTQPPAQAKSVIDVESEYAGTTWLEQLQISTIIGI